MTRKARLGRAAVWIRGWARQATSNARDFWARRQPVLWLLALLIGTGVGLLAVGFREAIGLVQWLWLFERGERVIELIRAQPWWLVVLAPTAGGLAVGLINQHFLSGRRPETVSDVIQARLEGSSTLTARNGFASAIATAISLGAGASAGREGPVVHLGATAAAVASRYFRIPERDRRCLLGCGVAAAISASFNAPIAGVLFAHEVILAHYAVSFFVPITIAAVAGTLITRSHRWVGRDARRSDGRSDRSVNRKRWLGVSKPSSVNRKRSEGRGWIQSRRSTASRTPPPRQSALSESFR